LGAALERRGARRVIAPERYAPGAGAPWVDVAPRLQPVEHRLHRFLVLGADREIVFGFALSRTVEGERGETTGEEALLVVVHFLLRRVEPHAHHDDRSSRGARGPAQVAVEVLPFVGNGHPLAWRHEMRQRPVAAFNR